MRAKPLFVSILVCAAALAGCKGGKTEPSVKSLTPAPEETVMTAEASGTVSASETASAPETVSAPETAETAFGAFSFRFIEEAFSRAREAGEKNPVLSPASAYAALLLTAYGSDGVSRDEFEEVLGLPEENWSEASARLMSLLNQASGSLLVRSANSVWVDELAQVREEYTEQVSRELHAEIFQAKLDSPETMEAVNEWVSERTGGMIPEFRTDPYGVTVRLALLNALYLEARFQEPFRAEATGEEVFYTGDGEVRTLFLRDWMCSRDYVKGEGIEGILLPYRDGSLAFLALRATDGRTPEELSGSLTPEKLRELIESAENVMMDFSMPKFTVEYRQNLSATLRELGLSRTMTPTEADLSRAGTGTDGARLYIGDAQQAVKLEVDEDGTKAAAVTEVTEEDGGVMMPDELVTLHLNSPFLYLIVDTESSAPLFMGLMEEPQG